MKTFILIVILFTPGSAHVDTKYTHFDSFEACYIAKAIEEKKLNDEGKSYIALCDVKQ